MPSPRNGRSGRGRSTGVAEHRTHTALSRGRVLLVALIVALVSAPAAAGAQDGASTGDQIERTRAAIDRVAQRWFEGQQATDRIDAEISALEGEVASAQAHADRVAVIARDRAVEIYMGSGTDFGPVLDSTDALDSARRAELLDRANSESRKVLDEFEVASERLADQRAELERRREEQQQAADQLASEQQELEARLASLQAQAAAEAAAATAARARKAAAAPAPSARSAATPAAAPRRTSSPPAQPTVAPPPPAPAGTHPHHDDPFLVCTRQRESRGNYSVVSASGLYHGAYQFLATTWNATASHAGRPELIGVLPSRASAYDQDDMAWTLYQWQGKRPWGGRC
jgi:septal ring factor EnvC (AmiA/AmiB activator)